MKTQRSEVEILGLSKELCKNEGEKMADDGWMVAVSFCSVDAWVMLHNLCTYVA